MGILRRGFKNAFRNGIRTLSITAILAISMSLALIMLLALKTVQSRITDVKGSIGNILTISPAGARSFDGGGDPLTNDQAPPKHRRSATSSACRRVLMTV